jgi:glycosyltransferase involved in cell wall biosynthesis
VRQPDADPALDVSVVICAYTEERWDPLTAAVRSAREQSQRPKEVIVVVDHNESLLARASRQLDDATVVPNSFASGLSGARNAGAAAARGGAVAFLDDDAAAASPDWLERLAAPLADPGVLGTGGRVDPYWQSGRPRWFPPEFDWVVGCTYRGMPERDGMIRNPIGANMAVRRSTLEELGGFRTDTGPRRNAPAGGGTAGTDETELAIRAAKRWPSRRWVYVPSALVLHQVPPTRATWRFFRSRCRDEGRAKAALATLGGGSAALSSERSYAMRELPKAVGRGIADTVARRDPGGLMRAAAVIVGLAEAAAGYASWSVRSRRSS